MHKIGSYLFWALAACTLHQGSLAEDQSVYILLQGVETELKGQLQALQVKIENQLQTILNKIENQPLAVPNKCDGHEEAAKVEVPDLLRNKIPAGFERIGTRYFRLGEEYVDWYTAKTLCREMGGYLASFRSEEELNTVRTKFPKNFWLGINDDNLKGHFVSAASHKPPQYLKWSQRTPSDDPLHLQNCVHLEYGKMWIIDCLSRKFFLCQADNET